MRPPFAYYGGKTRLASKIVALLPSHRIYTEPFAGSLAVLLAKEPCVHEVVNDLDGDIVNFWKQLRDRPEELSYACWATPYSREEYRSADIAAANDELERVRRWWVRVSQSHGRTNTTSGWSTGFARSGSRASETQRSAERILDVAKRLRRVTIENRDAVEIITSHDAPDTVHYVDPPYLDESRRSIGYAVEMGGEVEHRRLADALAGCVGTVVLSGYATGLYQQLYSGWDRFEIPAIKSNGGREGATGKATEVLWSNRPFPRDEQLALEVSA